MQKMWGQLLMVGIPGQEVDETTRYLIQELQVGGIILFKRNIAHPLQVAALIRDCQELALTAGSYPLLVAVDQEGGPVQRLRDPFPEMPSARQFGAAGDLAAVAASARQIAVELRALGVNLNLAPVLDVPRNSDCPLWERSYSTDPEQVARFGLAAVQGYLAGGVLPVVKHFPGLGATDLDSHLDLPAAAPGLAQRDIDLLPFRRAVAAGVPGVMCAHVLVPEWDALPASLSRVAVTRILRQELGFSGLIFTDDLEMGAILKQWPLDQAAPLAVAAGHDILLICEHLDHIQQTAAALRARTDLEPQGRAAWRRVLEHKLRLFGPKLDTLSSCEVSAQRGLQSLLVKCRESWTGPGHQKK
jgi:beta-N-acetylhexosaminidase